MRKIIMKIDEIRFWKVFVEEPAGVDCLIWELVNNSKTVREVNV